MKERLTAILIIIFLFGCASTEIKPTTQNSWECINAKENENVFRCITKPNSYFHRIDSPLSAEGFFYLGPAIQTSDGMVPHGWGELPSTGEEIFKIKFSNGSPRLADFTFENGNTYSGSIDTKIKWKRGTFFIDETSEVFTGSFISTDSGNRFDEGKLETEKFIFDGKFYKEPINMPRKGKIIGKNDVYEYDGLFKKDGTFYLGKYKWIQDNCEIIFNGVLDHEPMQKVRFNTNATFAVTHPKGFIRKTGELISVTFKNGEKFVAPITNDENLAAFNLSDRILRFNDEYGDFEYATLIWNDFIDCESKPNFLDKEIVLPGTNKRYFYTEGVGSKENVYKYGFKKIAKNELTDYEGQIFTITYKEKEISRNITEVFSEESEYVSGRREVFNPQYDKNQLIVDKAYVAWQNAERETFDCPYNAANPITCAILSASYETAADNREQEYYNAREILARTPRTILEDVLSSYMVEKVKIKAVQNAVIVASIIDFENTQIFEKEYYIDNIENFTVVNSPIAESDPNKSRLQRNSSTENEVDKWMKKEILLNESPKSIFDELIRSTPSKSNKKYLKDYVKNIVQNSRSNTTNSIKDTFNSDNDYELEDSIMVVSNLEGSGTAFYVNKNYLITNQHVVEDSRFVNLKNQYEESFTAEVIDTDIATDLALIKTTSEGIPLKLEPQCNVKRREEIFTIGHPVGYEYSTTRGIVSAIRDIPNPFYKATGIKKYIQIDAPISRGNSGGPLFNSKNQIVGVNTWGDNQGQNLNFAVHCSELKNFLTKNGVPS